MFLPPYHIVPPQITSGNVYHFTTGSGTLYEVRFARKKDNLLHVTIAFGVLNDEYEGEEYAVTNKGEVFRVMSTVVEVVKIYMREHPNLRTFEFTGEPTAKETDNTASKRLNLYHRYLRSIFDDHWEFRPTGNHMVITRRD
jgi:hypothetical protein